MSNPGDQIPDVSSGDPAEHHDDISAATEQPAPFGSSFGDLTWSPAPGELSEVTPLEPVEAAPTYPSPEWREPATSPWEQPQPTPEWSTAQAPGFPPPGMPLPASMPPGGGYAQPGYAQSGYAQSGYAQPGYPGPGYSQPGYPQPGYPMTGYPMTGYPMGYGSPVMENPFGSRATTTLVVSIIGALGLFCCIFGVCSPIALVMGYNVKKQAAEAGWPEPTNNKAGRIIGIIGTVIWVLGLAWLAFSISR